LSAEPEEVITAEVDVDVMGESSSDEDSEVDEDVDEDILYQWDCGNSNCQDANDKDTTHCLCASNGDLLKKGRIILTLDLLLGRVVMVNVVMRIRTVFVASVTTTTKRIFLKSLRTRKPDTRKNKKRNKM
jgi:hypothetical protein